MSDRFALVSVALIDGNGTDPVRNAAVVVDGRTIVYAGPRDRAPLGSGTRVIDAAGAVVMPGIVDAHCHLGGASFPDEDMWVLEPDTYQAIASVAQAGAMLRHGVTSVRDISVNGPHLRKAIRKGLIDGPRIVPCWRGLSRRGGHGDGLLMNPEAVRTSHPWGIVADGPDEVRRATREVIKQGGQCVKVWASGGGLHENEPEDAQHYSFDELRTIVEEATFARIPVAAHCEGRDSAQDAVSAGVWSVEHGEDLGEETIALMAANGVFLNPTLVLLTQWFGWESEGGYYGSGTPYVPGGGDLPSDMEARRAIHRERLSANLIAAKQAGVRIGVGSDSFCTGLTPFGQQTLDEVRALVAAGLSEMEALVAATRTGAQILRIESVTGTLERGKSADLIVLREDPLDDIARLDEPNMLAIVKEGTFVRNLIE
jgi:imidazolonepropionase-like amidohydrolase